MLTAPQLEKPEGLACRASHWKHNPVFMRHSRNAERLFSLRVEGCIIGLHKCCDFNLLAVCRAQPKRINGKSVNGVQKVLNVG